MSPLFICPLSILFRVMFCEEIKELPIKYLDIKERNYGVGNMLLRGREY